MCVHRAVLQSVRILCFFIIFFIIFISFDFALCAVSLTLQYIVYKSYNGICKRSKNPKLSRSETATNTLQTKKSFIFYFTFEMIFYSFNVYVFCSILIICDLYIFIIYIQIHSHKCVTDYSKICKRHNVRR